MKKLLLIFLVFIITIFSSFSQSGKMDSLKNEYQKEIDIDKSILLHEKIINEYVNENLLLECHQYLDTLFSQLSESINLLKA